MTALPTPAAARPGDRPDNYRVSLVAVAGREADFADLLATHGTLCVAADQVVYTPDAGGDRLALRPVRLDTLGDRVVVGTLLGNTFTFQVTEVPAAGAGPSLAAAVRGIGRVFTDDRAAHFEDRVHTRALERWGRPARWVRSRHRGRDGRKYTMRRLAVLDERGGVVALARCNRAGAVSWETPAAGAAFEVERAGGRGES